MIFQAVSESRLEDALKDLAKFYGVTVAMIRSPRKHQDIATIRLEAYALLRSLGASYPRIGRLCGGRDHSTVMAGIRQRAKRIMATDRAQYVAQGAGL